MRRTPMPARVIPLHRDLATVTIITGGGQVIPFPRKPRPSGFSRAVKLLCRTRSGDGDPDKARCEATGVWLGRYGGEIQHRAARGMGGTSLEVTNSIVNAVLLSREAHRLAEARDPGMGEEGFWLRSGQDPATTPILLHFTETGGETAWLTADGYYDFERPGDGDDVA